MNKGMDSRLLTAVGFATIAVACVFNAEYTSAWSAENYFKTELLMGAGQVFAMVGLVGTIVLQAFASRGLDSPYRVLTFSAFFHVVRLFGGQIGVAAMTRFIAVREQFHSNMLGLYIQRGSWLTDHRVRMLTGGLLPESMGQQEAQQRAGAILGLQVRAQAYTLATSDGFVLIVWVVIAYLLLMLLLRPGKISFNDLSKMQ